MMILGTIVMIAMIVYLIREIVKKEAEWDDDDASGDR